MTLAIAVVIPMPSAIVRMARTENPGWRTQQPGAVPKVLEHCFHHTASSDVIAKVLPERDVSEPCRACAIAICGGAPARS